jgi:hypothetical protein
MGEQIVIAQRRAEVPVTGMEAGAPGKLLSFAIYM